MKKLGILPDDILNAISTFEPDSREHERLRQPDDITVWKKHSVKCEIENGTCRLINRILRWGEPNQRVILPIFGPTSFRSRQIAIALNL